jgi:hypothetical protein
MPDAKIVEGVIIPGNVGWVVRINLITAVLILLLFAMVRTPASHLTPQQKQLLESFQRLVNEDELERPEACYARERYCLVEEESGAPVLSPVSLPSNRHDFPTEAERYRKFILIALLLVSALSIYGLVVQMPLLVWLAGNHPTTPWLRSWWQRFRFANVVSAGLENGSRIALLTQLPVWWALSTAIGLWRLAQDQSDAPLERWQPAESRQVTSASPSYDSIAANEAAVGRLVPQRSMPYVLLRGWPADACDAARVKAMLFLIYPSEAVLEVELIYRGRPAEPERRRLLRSLQARYAYLASLSPAEIHIPLAHWRWTSHPTLPMQLAETWRQAELGRLSRKLDRLQGTRIPDMTSIDPREHFTGWVVVRFSDFFWFRQCLRDFGQSSRRVFLGRSVLFRHLHPAMTTSGELEQQMLLAEPTRTDSETAGMAQPDERLRRRRIEGHAVLGHLRAEPASSLADIRWSHLGMSWWQRWSREGVLNLLFGLGLIFLSSPVAILSILQVVAASATNAAPAGLEALMLGNQRWLVAPLSSRVRLLFNQSWACFRVALYHLGWTKRLGGQQQQQQQQIVTESLSASTGPLVPTSSWPAVFLLSYLPVGLLMLINSAVPWMLRLIGVHEGHPTRAAEDTSVLRKSIAYYLLNTLILPSLAMNTAAEIVLLAYRQSAGGQTPQRALEIAERIFRGDNAFFYANFLIQLALTGNTLALLHPVHWIRFLWSRQKVCTPLMLAEARQATPFDYPYAYAQIIKVLSIGFFLGPFVPLLWPFIWLYLASKYAVDHYNLCWVHPPPSHTDERLARAATNAAAAVLVTAMSILVLLSWLYANSMLLGILLVSLLYLSSISLSVGRFPNALRPLHHLLRLVSSEV